MTSQGVWAAPIVSFVLNPDPLPSYVTMGGLPNSSDYIGKFVHQPVYKKDKTWWTVHATTVKVGN
jgi:hypothetical protein